MRMAASAPAPLSWCPGSPIAMRPGADWRGMAWWIHDHLPYAHLQFFPKLAAFNIQWHERPTRQIESFIKPRGLLDQARHGEPRGQSCGLVCGLSGLKALQQPLAFRPFAIAGAGVDVAGLADVDQLGAPGLCHVDRAPRTRHRDRRGWRRRWWGRAGGVIGMRAEDVRFRRRVGVRIRRPPAPTSKAPCTGRHVRAAQQATSAQERLCATRIGGCFRLRDGGIEPRDPAGAVGLVPIRLLDPARIGQARLPEALPMLRPGAAEPGDDQDRRRPSATRRGSQRRASLSGCASLSSISLGAICQNLPRSSIQSLSRRRAKRDCVSSACSSMRAPQMLIPNIAIRAAGARPSRR